MNSCAAAGSYVSIQSLNRPRMTISAVNVWWAPVGDVQLLGEYGETVRRSSHVVRLGVYRKDRKARRPSTENVRSRQWYWLQAKSHHVLPCVLSGSPAWCDTYRVLRAFVWLDFCLRSECERAILNCILRSTSAVAFAVEIS